MENNSYFANIPVDSEVKATNGRAEVQSRSEPPRHTNIPVESEVKATNGRAEVQSRSEPPRHTDIPVDCEAKATNGRAEVQSRSVPPRHTSKRRHKAAETHQHQCDSRCDDIYSFPGRRDAASTPLEGQVAVFSAKFPKVTLNEDKRNKVPVANTSYYATIPASVVNNTTAGNHSLKMELRANVNSPEHELKKPQTPKYNRLFRNEDLTRSSRQHKSGHESSGSERRPPVALRAHTNMLDEERSSAASSRRTSREDDAVAGKRVTSELHELYKCDHESDEHNVGSFEAAGTIAHLSQIPVSVSRMHAPLDFKKYIDLRDNYSASLSGTSDPSNKVQSRTLSVETGSSSPQRRTKDDSKERRRSASVEEERRRTGYLFPAKSSVIQRMDANDKDYNDRMNEYDSDSTQEDLSEKSWERSLPDSLERLKKFKSRNPRRLSKKGDTTSDVESDENQSDADSDFDESAAENEEDSQSSPHVESHDSHKRRDSPYLDDLKQFQEQILGHTRKNTDEEIVFERLSMSSSQDENQSENMRISTVAQTNVRRPSDEHKTNKRESLSSREKYISPNSAQKRNSTPWPTSEELDNLKLAAQDPLTQNRKRSNDVETEYQRRRSSSTEKKANENKADSNTQTSPSLLINATKYSGAHNTNRRDSPTLEDSGATLNRLNQDRKNINDANRLSQRNRFSSIDETQDEDTQISPQIHVRRPSDEYNTNKRDSQSAREENILLNSTQKRNTPNLEEINNLKPVMEVRLSPNRRNSNDIDVKSQRRRSGSIDENLNGNNGSITQKALVPQIIVRGPSDECRANELETQSLREEKITLNSARRRNIPEVNNLELASVQDPLTVPPQNTNDINTQNQRRKSNSIEESANENRNSSNTQIPVSRNMNVTRYSDAQKTNTGEPQTSREEKILARLTQNRKNRKDVELTRQRRRSSSTDGSQNGNATSSNIQTSSALQRDNAKQSVDEQKRDKRESQTSNEDRLPQNSSTKTETALPTLQKQIEKVRPPIANSTAVDDVSKIVSSLPTRSSISSQDEGNITGQYRHNSKPPANHLANYQNNLSRITEGTEPSRSSTPAPLPSSTSYKSHIHMFHKGPELTKKMRSVSPDAVPGAHDGSHVPSVYAMQSGTRRHLAPKEEDEYVDDDEDMSEGNSNDSQQGDDDDSNESQESEDGDSVSNESNPEGNDEFGNNTGGMEDNRRLVNVMKMIQSRGRGRMSVALPNNNAGNEVVDVHSILNQFTGVHIERNSKTPVPKDPETFPDIPKTASRRYLADHLSHHGSKQYVANRSSERLNQRRYGNVLHPQSNRTSRMYNATVENNVKIPLELLPNESAFSVQLKDEALDEPQFVAESQQREDVDEEQKSRNRKNEAVVKRVHRLESQDRGGNKNDNKQIINKRVEPEMTTKNISGPDIVNIARDSEGKDTPWFHQSKRTSHLYPTHIAKFTGLPPKKLPRESERSVQVKAVDLDVSEMEVLPPPQPQSVEKDCACKHVCDSSALQ